MLILTNQSVRDLITSTNYNLYVLIGRNFILYISKSINELESKYFHDILNMSVNCLRVEKQQNTLILELEDLT